MDVGLWQFYPVKLAISPLEHTATYLTACSPAMGSIGIQQEQVYDVLIIGAGFSGICSLYHIRQRFQSWRIKVLEAGSDVGGT